MRLVSGTSRGGWLFVGSAHWLLVLLLSYESSTRLASGQLEAVGAVLSVVPVTSILATAGLVGVKLAALSRLLQVLGYDQAYLASGGSGTAAQPIGLQTNYAYMFPYVPGLNISVKGEHSSQYMGPHSTFSSSSQQQQQQSSDLNNRKTYPAMGLPGDYEHQPRPFRGSDMLSDIFRDAGLNVRFPSQQQQLQQQTGLPGNGNEPNYQPNYTEPPNRDNSNIPTPSTTSNYNRQPQPQTYNPEVQASSSSYPTGPEQPSYPAAQQPAQFQPQTGPLQQPQTQPQQPTAHQVHIPQSDRLANRNSQVNMPHPHHFSIFRLPLSPAPVSASSGVVSGTEVAVGNSLTGALSSPPSSDAAELISVSRQFHPVPQHGYFFREMQRRLREQVQLAHQRPAVPGIRASQAEAARSGHDSGQRPPSPPVLGEPSNAPTSNDFGHNFAPRPLFSDPPPFHDDSDESNNEFRNVVNRRRRRRKRRSLSQQPAEPANPSPSLGDKLVPSRQVQFRQPKIRDPQTFGMPALNIHSIRRRRRSLRDILFDETK